MALVAVTDHAVERYLQRVRGALEPRTEIAARVGIGLVYKTSFDKANRTSATSARGLGLDKALAIFAEVRDTLGLPVLTDVHERDQCAPVAQAVDILQIPAFLSRQTDLLVAAAHHTARHRKYGDPLDCSRRFGQALGITALH